MGQQLVLRVPKTKTMFIHGTLAPTNKRCHGNAPQAYTITSYLHAAAFHCLLEHVSERLMTYARVRRASVSLGGGGVDLIVPAACG